ncbi:mucin-5B-like [Haliotis rufescens]|uniref:mucin-5B-like n=1 Tax=Haliotis rufescens TaxID=6454 RepID=UPI00201EC265|nr:mucin-5B-like [Haliotis rufescens]
MKMLLRRVFVLLSFTYLCICQVLSQFAENSLCRQLYRGTCRTSCRVSETRLPVPDSVLFCRGGACCKSDRSPGIWGAWTTWSPCTESCGDGVRTRSRTCQFGQCLGAARQTGQCRRAGCLLLPQTTSTVTTSATTSATPSSATTTTASSETTPTTPTTSPVMTSTSPDTSETTVPTTSPTTASSTSTTVPVVKRSCGSVRDQTSTVPVTDCSGNPWTVSLQIINTDGDAPYRFPVCSGVLLSMTEILTTAACAKGLKRILDVPTLQSLAVAGSETGGTQSRTITNVTLFEQTAETLDVEGDLAIVNVGNGFEPDTCASAACLPNTNDVFNTGDRCRLTGWKRDDVTATPSVILVSQQQAPVTLLPSTTCQAIYIYLDPNMTVYSDSVCTDSGKDNFAPCEDANGWMLVCDNSDGSATLVGLATPGSDCITILPSIFQGVQMHMDWIEKRVPSLYERGGRVA